MGYIYKKYFYYTHSIKKIIPLYYLNPQLLYFNFNLYI